MKPENMKEFFEARLEDYDRHMLEEVVGCRGGYAAMAAALPEHTKRILDLGAGTGLELVPILERFPNMAVSAVDLSGRMLARLRERFADKHNLCAVAGDYTKIKYGIPFFDAIISFEAFHHHTPEERLELYKTIRNSLLRGGVYIEGDYTARDDAEEATMQAAAKEARSRHGIPDDVRVHLDIPLTVEHTKALLLEAGFTEVRVIYTEGATTVLIAIP